MDLICLSTKCQDTSILLRQRCD